MGKSRQPRKRKSGTPPPPELTADVPTPPRGEAAQAEQPKHDIVVRRTAPPPAELPPLLVQFAQTLRLVAERMIDIADAAAEAVKRRIEGRA